MYTLGPFSMTPGTPVGPLQLGKDIGAIQIHNDSPYNVYVYPQAAAPSATDSLNGGYNGVATPFSHPVIRLQPRSGSPAEQQTNAIASFGGTLYLMPVDPQAALARNGTVSSLAQVHLDVYSQWETPPEAWANPRQMDLTSQPRVISLPSVPDHIGAGTLGSIAATGGALELTAARVSFFAIPTGVRYLFPIIYSFDLFGFSGTNYDNVFDIQAAGYANGVQDTGTFTLYTGILFNPSSGSSGRVVCWDKPYPLAGAAWWADTQGKATPYTIRFFFNWHSGPAALNGLAYTLQTSVIESGPGLTQPLVPALAGGSFGLSTVTTPINGGSYPVW